VAEIVGNLVIGASRPGTWNLGIVFQGFPVTKTCIIFLNSALGRVSFLNIISVADRLIVINWAALFMNWGTICKEQKNNLDLYANDYRCLERSLFSTICFFFS